jgi:hypothetical protein
LGLQTDPFSIIASFSVPGLAVSSPDGPEGTEFEARIRQSHALQQITKEGSNCFDGAARKEVDSWASTQLQHVIGRPLLPHHAASNILRDPY